MKHCNARTHCAREPQAMAPLIACIVLSKTETHMRTNHHAHIMISTYSSTPKEYTSTALVITPCSRVSGGMWVMMPKVLVEIAAVCMALHMPRSTTCRDSTQQRELLQQSSAATIPKK